MALKTTVVRAPSKIRGATGRRRSSAVRLDAQAMPKVATCGVPVDRTSVWHERRIKHQNRRSALSQTRPGDRLTTRTLDLLGICCAGVVRIDLLGRSALIERDEPVKQVVACCVVVVAAGVVGEVVAEW